MANFRNYSFGTLLRLVIFIENCVGFCVFAEEKPTLDEIAAANARSWNAITTVEMDFAVLNESRAEGSEFLTTSIHNRWIAMPEKERLTRIYHFGDSSESLLSDSLLTPDSLREHQASSSENGDALFCGTISPAIHPLWQNRVNLSPYLLRYPCGEIDMDTTKTLQWILAHWDSTLENSGEFHGDTLWQIRVRCPKELPWDGGTMRIFVNADKGFLVQKVIINGLGMNGEIVDEKLSEEYQERLPRTTIEMEIIEFVRTNDRRSFFPSGFICRRFSEPITQKSSPHTVYKEIPTRLGVNTPLPDHCFDFQFKKGEIVTQYDSASEIIAVFLWGENNVPAHAFASYEELDCWQFRQDLLVVFADSFVLTRIIGKDIGDFIRQTMESGHRYLMAKRQRQKEQLQALAPLPINKTTPSEKSALPSETPQNAVLLSEKHEKSDPQNGEIVPVTSIHNP
ncbi:MAG: hypothetical protein LBT05_09365 [Planctomycetaceae bacterium]|jgi:hypothetical protein|nr:hypothetical protein [Planctomycetaceae bacterium]